jgi:hypothetical protein
VTFAPVLLRTLRLAIPIYLVSLMLGLLGTALLLAGLSAVAGNRPWLGNLLGSGWFNVLVEVGLSAVVAPPPDRATVATLALDAVLVPPILLVLQWFGYTFVAGGIVERLRIGRLPHADTPSFWADCRRWFWPFVRLGILGMLFVLVLAAIAGVVLAVLGSAVRLSVSLVLFAAWLAILFGWLEMARATMVWHGDRSAYRALERAAQQVIRPRSLLVWLVLALPVAGLLALGMSRVAVGDALASIGPLPMVIIGQIVAFLGAWVKMIRLAVAWRLVAGRRTRGQWPTTWPWEPAFPPSRTGDP